MPRTFFASFALVGFFALTACKQGGGDDTGTVIAQPIPEQELPDATAAALCELFFGCSCENPEYPDQVACTEAWNTTVDEQQQAAQAAGLIYDPQCAGDLLAVVEASGCEAQVPLDCDTYCAAYHGEQGVGASCTVPIEEQPTWSDCAQGLWCLQGTCQDACGANAGLGLGEMCRDDQGESLGNCQTGLWCDFETNNCIALPAVGEPCYLGEICGAGAICDFSGSESVCIPVPGAGEACTYACDVGLYCDGVDGAEGTCVVLPGEGQPCSPSGGCAEGSLCNDAAVCEALPPWVCSV